MLDDNMITYDEYQNDSGVDTVRIVVSADEAYKQSMIAVLQCMHTEIAGYVKVNDEHKLVNATLTAELERCKIEMQALKRNKVKHDLDMTIVEWNKQNVDLKKENVMLKSTLKSKVVSIENLQQESKQVLSEKKTLEDKYLEEMVILTNANKVATNVLKGFQMPTHTISMLSKRPNFASHDLHKTGLGYSNPRYGKQARISQPSLYDGHVLLNSNHPPTRVHDSKESLVHAEVCKIKIDERPGHALPINYAKLNALYDQFVPQKEFSSSTPAKPVAHFVHTRPVKSDVHKKVWKIKECITAFEKIIKERTAPPPSILSSHWDLVVPPSSDSSHCMLKELRTTCDKEHSKVLELKAEILKKKQVINDAVKRCAFIQNEHVKLQLKFQKYKECDTSNSTASNAIFEINKLKEQLQGRDDSIRNLQAQNDIISLLIVGSTDDSSNTHLRTTSLEKIAAQKAEIATLNAKNVGNKTSGTTKPANPKETPKPPPSFTKKPIAQLLKKPNVNVSLSIGIKSATGASKPASKSNAWIYRKFSAKSVKGEKAKNIVRTTKKVWRPKVVTSVEPMWKPTGWHFTLYNSYPLTRTLEPTVEPIELSPSVSSSTKIPMLSKFVDVTLGMEIGQFCNGGLKVAFRQHTCHIRNMDKVDLLQARKDLVRGLLLLKYDKDHLCPSCQLGKSKNASHPFKTENINVEVLSTLHMDLYGPMRTESINKKKYVLVIVDDYTIFGWVRFLRTKDETPEVFLKFLKNTQRALNATVRMVRTDNGTEFVNKTLTDLFESVGITHQTSVPRSPQQNGTYYELLKGKKPDLKYFRVFSSLCDPTNDYDDVGKLKAKADIGIFVGYALTKKAYRVYHKRTRKIQETVHVTFDELSGGITFEHAPEIAIATPSTTLISEGTPAVTISPSVSESSPQDTSVHSIETPIDDVDNNLYETYIAPKAVSEASSSIPVNAYVTPNLPIAHVQK
nr:retrovirus-related Pol polyprotein from transposon TNT 1-94 [Tanacetum cinerariifolium]